MGQTYKTIDTKLIHSGEPEPRIMGAVSMPIFQTAMYEYRDGGDYHDLQYIRLNNTPNHVALHSKLAALENSEAALVTASGMAAVDGFFDKVKLALVAPSLGGIETLVTRPAGTSHAGMSPQERKQAGISDTLIRISIGIEALEDLIADFNQALS